ncbi:MAG: hypothetical protein A4E72_01687 [Syntrophus sp. PtaU1.Bin208]|nr:MAG: hypothetical protein A4E72_01687 [Syntrophus sp. PtaU1.Bin208]
MSADSSIIMQIIVAFLSGGIGAAIVNHWLRKKETEVDIKKKMAEIENLNAQTEHLKQDIMDVDSKVKMHDAQLEKQQDMINQLVIFSLSYYLYDYLKRLYLKKEFKFDITKPYLLPRLILLRDLGYLEMFHEHNIHPGDNLNQKLKLTPAGEYFVELREKKENNI